MSAITTHVLDTSIGGPATGVSVLLERRTGHGEWSAVGRGETNADGRLAILMPIDDPLTSGIYRMTFDTGRYFEAQAVRDQSRRIALPCAALAEPLWVQHLSRHLNYSAYGAYGS